MQDGTDYTIRADAGEKLKVLGYINSDLFMALLMQRTLYPKATAILFPDVSGEYYGIGLYYAERI